VPASRRDLRRDGHRRGRRARRRARRRSVARASRRVPRARGSPAPRRLRLDGKVVPRAPEPGLLANVRPAQGMRPVEQPSSLRPSRRSRMKLASSYAAHGTWAPPLQAAMGGLCFRARADRGVRRLVLRAGTAPVASVPPRDLWARLEPVSAGPWGPNYRVRCSRLTVIGAYRPRLLLAHVDRYLALSRMIISWWVWQFDGRASR